MSDVKIEGLGANMVYFHIHEVPENQQPDGVSTELLQELKKGKFEFEIDGVRLQRMGGLPIEVIKNHDGGTGYEGILVRVKG